MNISREELSVLLEGVSTEDYPQIVAFIRAVKEGKPQREAENAYRAQVNLMHDLKLLYALTNITRLALTDLGQDETDSAADTLMLVVNQLYDLIEQQKALEKQLEQAAYPHDGGAA